MRRRLVTRWFNFFPEIWRLNGTHLRSRSVAEEDMVAWINCNSLREKGDGLLKAPRAEGSIALGLRGWGRSILMF